MDNKILIERDDSVGTDPSVVSVIETLDVTPTSADQAGKNKQKKGSSPLKSLLIILLVIIFMGGVGYGVYYYLHLGSNQPSKTKHALKEKVFYLNEELSKNAADYLDDTSENASACTINLDNVDNKKVGDYLYSVNCPKAIYEGKIRIVEKTILGVAGNIVYKQTNASFDINDFVSSSKEYTYSFKSEDTIKENIANEGLYPVEIIAKDKDNNEGTLYAVMSVRSEEPRFSLTCTKDNIEDHISFDNEKNDLHKSLRIYEYSYSDEKALIEALSEISDGKLKIGDNEGYPVTNIPEKKIKLVLSLTNDVLDKEYGGTFPTTYNDINNYYRGTKGYDCSI